MSRLLSYRFVMAALALVGMMFSSTVTAWATDCDDGCGMATMPCCDTEESDQDEHSDPRTAHIRALSCCPQGATACASTIRFDAGDAQAAHERGGDRPAPSAAVVLAPAVMAPQYDAGPLPASRILAPSPPSASTVVRLL